MGGKGALILHIWVLYGISLEEWIALKNFKYYEYVFLMIINPIFRNNWMYKTFHWKSAVAAAKSPQSCPTLCDPVDGSPPGSSVHGILQARTLEWVAISFSNAWKWKAKVKSLSHVWLFMTPGTAAYQAPPSMIFSRQEYWQQIGI